MSKRWIAHSAGCIETVRLLLLLLFQANEGLQEEEIGGVLNTFRNITEWAKHDRNFYSMAKARLAESKPGGRSGHDPQLIKKIKLYVKDYESSTLKHLNGLKMSVMPPSLLAAAWTWLWPKEEIESLKQDEFTAYSFLLVYKMVRRFTKYGNDLKKFLFHGTSNDAPPDHEWPGHRDHEHIKHVLLSAYNYHDIFYFPATFLQVLTVDSETPAEFTAEMAYDISQTAATVKKYVQAVDWINFASKLFNEGKTDLDTTLSKRFLLQAKTEILKKHIEDHDPDQLINDSGFYLHPIKIEEANTKREDFWIRTRYNQFTEFMGRRDGYSSDVNAWALCSGQEVMKGRRKARLRCHLDTKSNPIFRILPLRVEVLSRKPEVLQFHNVLSDSYADLLAERTEENSKKLGRISTFGRNSKEKENTALEPYLSVRSSVNVWYPDDELPELARLSGIITGLNGYSDEKDMSEPFQAVEYVVGRHYDVHLDAADDSEEDYVKVGGVRAATLLYYLNDVPVGGQTVFPNAMVAAMPVKGSAVFWRNAYRNGTLRNDVWHASCPTLFGRKMVINKWFRSHIQFPKLTCSTNRNE